MKKLFLIIFVALSLNGQAQSKTTENKTNAVQTKDGNFKAVTKKKEPVLTGQTYTDANGKTFPVYKSSNNKLFVVRTSKKTGNKYRYYLKTN